MLPSRCYRAGDVESALAEAAAIQQAVGNESKDKQATSRCQNPFCRAELCNSFASYCEGRLMCQRYRALRLQCRVNGESAAIHDIKALGRSDSFLTVRAEQHMRSISQGADGECEGKEEAETSMPFVIPRRKCPGTSSEYRPALSRKMKTRKTNATVKAANRDTPPGTNQQKRPRLGHRMHFNEVLAHFEPRTATAEPISASSSTRAKSIQESLRRRPRTAKTARKSSVAPRPPGITLQQENYGGGGRYVQSGNRPSLNSMRGLDLIPRPAYRPKSCSRVSPAAPHSADNNAAGTAISVAQRGLPSRQTETMCSVAQSESSLRLPHHAQDHSFTRARSHSTRADRNRERRPSREYRQSRSQLESTRLPRPSKDDQRVGYNHSRNVVAVPVPPSPTFVNGYSSRHTDTASTSTKSRQRESFSAAESYRPYTKTGEHFRVHGGGNCRNNCDRGIAVDSNWELHQERGLEERNCASEYSRTFQLFSDTRVVRGEDANGAESSADLSLSTENWPQNCRPNRSARVLAEQPVIASLRTCTVEPTRVPHCVDAAVESESSVDCEPTFSCHDAFIRPLLSLFIQKLPSQLEPVMNVTKRPRKVKWYVEYTKKIERACKPYMVIQLQSTQIVVLVHNRVWLELKGPSTILLLQCTIKTMRAEAISWRLLKSEVEECLELYRNRSGDDVDMSNVFLRAWDNLKARPSALSLPRQSTYFCGSRLHHWKFVVGKVEIGSGSHEEKREAFRLATISAADFLLQLDDDQNNRRWRPYRRNSFSSESSEECEFLYVRNVNNESVAADAAITVSDNSPDSATSDVSTTAKHQDENAVTARNSTTQIDDSDTEDEELPMTVDPAVPILDNDATTTKKSCNLCEVIRMRKPDSTGCRQCQVIGAALKRPKRIQEAAKKAPRVDFAATAQPFSAQPPPKSSSTFSTCFAR